jgi:hypothetical protein
LTIEDSSGFWTIAFRDVVSAVGHDSPNDMAQLVGSGRDSDQVMFILAMFFTPKVPQITFRTDGSIGHLPESLSEIG